jgi:hypothetical protein
LLKWVKKTTDDSVAFAEAHDVHQSNGKMEAKHKIAVCFCGPPALGAMLNDTVSELGADLEYNAHTQ